MLHLNMLAEQGRIYVPKVDLVMYNDRKRELANELLFGELAKGGNVKVDYVDDKLTFEYSGVDTKSEQAEPS